MYCACSFLRVCIAEAHGVRVFPPSSGLHDVILNKTAFHVYVNCSNRPLDDSDKQSF